MFIILEGVDGTGKSTLCKKLTDLGVYDVIPPRSDVVNNFQQWCSLIDIGKTIDVVVDRSFISDLVYRLSDDKEVGTLNLVSMSLLIASKGIVIIHCNTEKAFYYAKQRGEDNITDENLHKTISKNYETIMTIFKKFTDAKVLTYDWTKEGDFDKIVNYIKEVRNNDSRTI